MRELGAIDHPEIKITLFQWNNKFMAKFERGMLEQTYKVSEFDVASEQELRSLINEPFIGLVLRRFEEMAKDWGNVLMC